MLKELCIFYVSHYIAIDARSEFISGVFPRALTYYDVMGALAHVDMVLLWELWLLWM